MTRKIVKRSTFLDPHFEYIELLVLTFLYNVNSFVIISKNRLFPRHTVSVQLEEAPVEMFLGGGGGGTGVKIYNKRAIKLYSSQGLHNYRT
jgi:hypothetical protein